MIDIHVSPNGHDGGSTSSRDPVRSLAHVNRIVRSGDRILLEAGGVWTDAPLVLPERVSVEPYGSGDWPVLEKMQKGIVFAGAGSSVTGLNVRHMRWQGVTFEADECAIQELLIERCGLVANDRARAVSGFNIKNPKILSCTVRHTDGSDNIYFYNCPDVWIEGCDLDSPGRHAGDNVQLSGCNDFYVGRNRMSDVPSGKGHFISQSWKQKATGGVVEHNEFHGSANFAVAVAQPNTIVRYNKMHKNERHKTAKWSSAIWVQNEETFSPLSNIQVHNNLVIGWRSAFGSWCPKREYPLSMRFENETYVDCDNWFNWGGDADLTGEFKMGLLVRCGERGHVPSRMRFADNFFI